MKFGKMTEIASKKNLIVNQYKQRRKFKKENKILWGKDQHNFPQQCNTKRRLSMDMPISNIDWLCF